MSNSIKCFTGETTCYTVCDWKFPTIKGATYMGGGGGRKAPGGKGGGAIPGGGRLGGTIPTGGCREGGTKFGFVSQYFQADQQVQLGLTVKTSILTYCRQTHFWSWLEGEMRWEGQLGEGIPRDRRRRKQRWLSQQLVLVSVGNVGLEVSLGEVATTTPLVIVSGGGKEEGYIPAGHLRKYTLANCFHFGAEGNLVSVLHCM